MSEIITLIQENVISGEKEIRYRTKLDGIEHSSEFYCLKCQKPVFSEVTYTFSQATYIWCLVLCLMTIICAFIPFCFQKCQNKTHYCPICQNQVGYTEGECC